jgi:hypothetical protein
MLEYRYLQGEGSARQLGAQAPHVAALSRRYSAACTCAPEVQSLSEGCSDDFYCGCMAEEREKTMREAPTRRDLAQAGELDDAAKRA